MNVTGPSSPTVLCPERTDQARRLFRETDCPSFWYLERCYRLERPQAGRWREFTQFGVEFRNPVSQKQTNSVMRDVLGVVQRLCPTAELHTDVVRGSSYYSGRGFEITVTGLGAQKQVCGGGPYSEGFGFAVGVERLMKAVEEQA